jgi:hypothetical protein
MIALEAQKRLPQWRDCRFVPFAAKWLEERRWEDNLADPGSRPAKTDAELCDEMRRQRAEEAAERERLARNPFRKENP